MITHQKKGFTLIEILVVIAVIAILAALVFPVFSAAREKARQAICLSNLRQLGAAIRMYADDNDGRLPAARVHEGGVGNPSGNWAGVYEIHGVCDPTMGQIYPYVKHVGIYLCRSANGVKLDRILPFALPYPLSYSMNYGLSYRKLDNIKAPASRVGLLIHEDASTIDDGDFYWRGWATGDGGYNRPARIHSGGATVLFCDLHCRWQPYDTVIQALRDGDWDSRKP